MTYVERAVAPGIEVWRSTGSPAPTRILPDACIDLILDGDRLCVAGPDTQARVHVGTAGRTLTGVRLLARRAPLLFGLPADELVDRYEPLDTIWSPRSAQRLADAVRRDPERALIRWGLTGEPCRRSELLRQHLLAGHPVGATAEALGTSARQLQRHTRTAFGYGPRLLTRILRIAHLAPLVDSGRPWAELVHEIGFSDQAHLTREVRALVGVTPTVWRAERVRSVQDTVPTAALDSPV